MAENDALFATPSEETAITVVAGRIGADTVQTVNARDLHAILEVGQGPDDVYSVLTLVELIRDRLRKRHDLAEGLEHELREAAEHRRRKGAALAPVGGGRPC